MTGEYITSQIELNMIEKNSSTLSLPGHLIFCLLYCALSSTYPPSCKQNDTRIEILQLCFLILLLFTHRSMNKLPVFELLYSCLQLSYFILYFHQTFFWFVHSLIQLSLR